MKFACVCVGLLVSSLTVLAQEAQQSDAVKLEEQVKLQQQQIVTQADQLQRLQNALVQMDQRVPPAGVTMEQSKTTFLAIQKWCTDRGGKYRGFHGRTLVVPDGKGGSSQQLVLDIDCQ